KTTAISFIFRRTVPFPSCPPNDCWRSSRHDVNVATRFERLTLPVRFQTQAALDAFADVGQGDTGHRLGLQQAPAIVRLDGKYQLKVLAVGQAMFQGRSAVV